jgi:type IV pilus assembly protein PilY1
MAYYCATPPFLASTATPNVLLIIDNSGSMSEFVYKEESVNRCLSGTTATAYKGYDDNKTYFGLFDSDLRYNYNNGNGYFEIDDNGDWSGNFLNWLTASRIDTVKKILTGGHYDNKNGYIIATADTDNLGVIRKVYDDSSTNETPLNGQKVYFYFYLYDGNLYFDLRKVENISGGCWNVNSDVYGTFRVRIKVTSVPTGLIQDTWDRVRYGVMHFNTSEGGYIKQYITDKYTETDVQKMIDNINNIIPSTWTPLGESLYEATRYFRAMDSYFNNGTKYSNNDPIKYTCQQNYVIVLTDGESTQDTNIPTENNNFDVKDELESIEKIEGVSAGSYKSYETGNDGTYNMAGVAYWAHRNDIRDDLSAKQKLNVMTVFAFDDSSFAKELLKLTAKYGNYTDKNNNDAFDNGTDIWDENNDGIPDGYYEATDGNTLKGALYNAIAKVVQGAGAGSGVALMTERVSSTSIAMQGLFNSKKDYDNGTLTWIGNVLGWWVYNADDSSVTIREDTIEDFKLNLENDYVINYSYETLPDRLRLIINKGKDSNGDGIFDNTSEPIIESVYDFDKTSPIFETGLMLFAKDPDERYIFTHNNINDYTDADQTLVGFDNDNISNNTALKDLLNGTTPYTYDKVIEYIRGKDFPEFRNRTAVIDNNTGTWKLGDIIHSRPVVVKYDDDSLGIHYNVLYVGSNDGMMHAFKVGYANEVDDPNDNLTKTELCYEKGNCTNTYLIGEEMWGFIPHSVMPYLKFLADPNYCHVYFVDQPPYIIEKGNKKILIGGLRLGGGCNCGNAKSDECIKCYESDNKGNCTDNKGLSSYFALDITEPKSPKFLWEFTHPDLGFSFSGPAYIKRKTKDFIMFSSGPTTYDGHTSKDLKFFVLELNGDFTISNNVTILDGKTNSAFGGKLHTNGIDKDNDGYTDFIVTGIIKNVGQTNSQGGLVVIHTKNDTPSGWDIYPNYYNFAQNPTVTKIVSSQCFDLGHYIYFGTGRYFYPGDDEGTNGNGNQENYIFGIPFDCDVKSGCQGSINNIHSVQQLDNPCEAITVDEAIINSKTAGWKIPLDLTDDVYLKERNIIDPITIYDPSNSFNQSVDKDKWISQATIFVTTKYEKDPCVLRGKTKIWGLNCATGGPLKPDNVTDKICESYQVTDNLVGLTSYQSGAIGITTEESFGNNKYIETDDVAVDITTNPYLNSGTSINYKGRILFWIEK